MKLTDKRYPRDRHGERRRRGVATAGTRRRGLAEAQPERRFVHHRLYGEIPLVAGEHTDPTGKIHRWWRYDPDYAPPLPRGAVRGNVRKTMGSGKRKLEKT